MKNGDLLTKSIANRCKVLLTPIPVDCGLHLTAASIAAQAEGIGIELYSLERYPIAGNGHNVFAFGQGMIRVEQIDEAVNSLSPG